MRHEWASRKGNWIRVRTNSFPSFYKYCLWLCKEEKKRREERERRGEGILMGLGPRELQSGDFTVVLTWVLTYSLILNSTCSNWFPSLLSELVHMLRASDPARPECFFLLVNTVLGFNGFSCESKDLLPPRICFSLGPRSHCSLGSMTSDPHLCSLRLWESLLSFQYIGNLDLLYSSRVNQLLVQRARK